MMSVIKGLYGPHKVRLDEREKKGGGDRGGDGQLTTVFGQKRPAVNRSG